MECACIKYERLNAKSAVQVGMYFASMVHGKLAAGNATTLEQEAEAFAFMANKKIGAKIAAMKVECLSFFTSSKVEARVATNCAGIFNPTRPTFTA